MTKTTQSSTKVKIDMPSITEEQYRDLIYFKRREAELIQQGFSLHEFVGAARTQVDEASAKLLDVRTELGAIQEGFSRYYKDVVNSYGIDDESTVAILDTIPHNIVPKDSLTAAPPDVPNISDSADAIEE